MHKIDEKLLKENIEFDYFRLKRMTIITVTVVMTLELSLVTYNLLLFQEFKLDSLYWICTGIPILLSTISKVWYVALVYNVKQKFCAINDHFENTRKFFDITKNDTVSKTIPKSPYKNGENDENDLPGYLHKEILCKPMRRNRKIQRIDEISVSGHVENDPYGKENIIMEFFFHIYLAKQIRRPKALHLFDTTHIAHCTFMVLKLKSLRIISTHQHNVYWFLFVPLL